jgi:murein DD-endopeptidase MepM/ murein hydrolase activator NlpD
VFLSRVAWRLMFAVGASALLAGCSDATRFSDPFSDPFQASSGGVDRAPTGAISTAQGEGPRSLIQSRPLPPPAPPQAASRSAPPAPIASIAPQPQTSPARRSAGDHWSAEGGTPIVVADGETVGLLATRYGVPTDALLRVNGFSKPSDVHPGSRLVIPVYRAAKFEPAAEPKAPAVKTADFRDGAGAPMRKAEPEKRIEAVKRIEPDKKADSARKIEPVRKSEAVADARKERKTASVKPEPPALPPIKQPPAQAAATKAAAGKTKVASADEPKAKAVQAEPVQKPASKPRQEQVAKKQEPAPAPKREEKPVQEAKRPAPAPEKREQPAVASAEAAAPHKIDRTETASIPASDAARPEFRWPARGRIIQGFNAGGNDGINIAVPEGTQVKAVESGVVAYAGSELKGYGNLVLIRHPNGFVSAYAHNGELEVKRGDQVKRGQTIARSGQSGNVGSPQLHFELRKGSTPVDPITYLAGS